MIKRLIGAMFDGIGWSAGRDLYKEGKKAVRKELAKQPRTEKELAKALRVADRRRLAVEKELAEAVKKREKTAESELAALKRKMGL